MPLKRLTLLGMTLLGMMGVGATPCVPGTDCDKVVVPSSHTGTYWYWFRDEIGAKWCAGTYKNFQNVSPTQIMKDAKEAITDKYGPIEKWDMSEMTSLRSAFSNAACGNFNADISEWDTSKVDSMNMAFYGAYKFNQDISAWDTSKVTSFRSMFNKAYRFNQDLNSWDTSSVTSMQQMFVMAYSFNNGGQPLYWDTSAVTSMEKMFHKAYSFNQDISWLDASELTTLKNILVDAVSFNRPLDEWGPFPKRREQKIDEQPFYLQSEPSQDAASVNIFTSWPANGEMPFLNECMASKTKIADEDEQLTLYDWQTTSTTPGDCPDRAAAPPVMCKDPGTAGYTMTNTNLDILSFDVTGVCADGYGGSVTVEACTEAGDYTVSGCDPACETNTCASNVADKQFRIPNIVYGNADTCCGPAWVVNCGLGTQANITGGECVGDPSSYSDSDQLRARWRELNNCANGQ